MSTKHGSASTFVGEFNQADMSAAFKIVLLLSESGTFKSLSLSLSVCLSVRLSVCLSLFSLSISLSLYLSIYLSWSTLCPLSFINLYLSIVDPWVNLWRGLGSEILQWQNFYIFYQPTRFNNLFGSFAEKIPFLRNLPSTISSHIFGKWAGKTGCLCNCHSVFYCFAERYKTTFINRCCCCEFKRKGCRLLHRRRHRPSSKLFVCWRVLSHPSSAPKFFMSSSFACWELKYIHNYWHYYIVFTHPNSTSSLFVIIGQQQQQQQQQQRPEPSRLNTHYYYHWCVVKTVVLSYYYY